MASVKVATDFVLRQEDATLNGKVTTLKGDKGGATRFGLASASHPELVEAGFFDESRVSREQALGMAEQAYADAYATPLKLAAISDQAVATAVLSLGINSGNHEAGVALQQACCDLGHAVGIDGSIGPGTLGVADAINPDQLLAAFSRRADQFYESLAAKDTADLPFLKGWENRVAAWTSNAASLRAQA